ncbi:MAG: (2Fe-2S)-binding protein [Planctomycetes bacterium]|nr:(2Fe-2S)-binding protein [Planctomycetota bacterium]
MNLELNVNGEPRPLDVDPWRRLLDVLREDLGLTGSKEGCGEGECGACSVLLDGEPVNSCLLPVGAVEGRAVRTVEDLASADALHPVQRALVDLAGTQCGICTPGIAVTAAWILETHPEADRAQVRTLLAGNLCRCTGYQLVVDAVMAALEAQR